MLLVAGQPRIAPDPVPLLYDGPDGFKEEIILLYRELGGEAAKGVLLDFIKNPWIKERFRHLAILVCENSESAAV